MAKLKYAYDSAQIGKLLKLKGKHVSIVDIKETLENSNIGTFTKAGDFKPRSE